jgi:hypothetical protein
VCARVTSLTPADARSYTTHRLAKLQKFCECRDLGELRLAVLRSPGVLVEPRISRAVEAMQSALEAIRADSAASSPFPPP